MATVKDIVFKIDFEVGKDGSIESITRKVDALQASVDGAKKGTLEYAEAEKKLTQATKELDKELGLTGKNAATLQNTLKPDNATAFAAAMKAAQAESRKLAGTILEQEKITAEFRTELQAVETELAKIGKGNKAFFTLEAEQKKLNLAIEENVAAIREMKVDKKTADQSVSDLKAVGKELGFTGEQAKTARARLFQIRELLLKGGLPAEQIQALKEEGGQLTDEIATARAELAALGDDNLGSSALIKGVQGAFGAMSAFQGVVALTTDDTEAFQEQMLRAQGALSALQGVQQLFITLQQESALVVQANIIRQKVLNFLYDETTGKLKKVNAALAIGTLGVVIAAIGLLAANWEKVSEALSGVSKQQKLLNDISKEAIGAISEEVGALRTAESQLFDTNTTQERRVEIIKELQSKYPQYLGNLNAETATNEQLAAALLLVNEELLIKAKIEAAQKLVDQETQKQLELQIALQNAQSDGFRKLRVALLEFTGQGVAAALQKNSVDIINSIDQTDKSLETLFASIKNFQNKLTAVQAQGIPLFPEEAVEKALKKVEDAAKEAEEKRVEAFKLQLAELAERERLAAALLGQNEVKEEERLKLSIFYATARLALLKSERTTTQLELQKAANDILILQSQLANIKPTEVIGEVANPPALDTDALRDEAERNEIALAQIAEAGEIAILNIRIRHAQERLKVLIAEGKATTEGLTKINNGIAELEAERAAKVGTQNDTATLQTIDNINAVVAATAQAADQIIGIEVAKYDRLIQLQQGQIDKAKDIASQGNAELLQAEEERLDELQRKRERFVRAQQAIIATQLVAEAALAIAKTAGQSGVAAPITITATLLALAAGLAQARALASQAAFFKGGDTGYTGTGNKYEVAGQVHKNEFVMDNVVTGIGRNREIFNDILTKRIDLQEYFNQPAPVIDVSGGISEEKFQELIAAVNRVPGSSVTLTERGVIKLTERGARKATRISSKI